MKAPHAAAAMNIGRLIINGPMRRAISDRAAA
jgi:hypothetical protein